MGQKRRFGTLLDVRYSPVSDRLLRCHEVTLCAISDQSAVQKTLAYYDAGRADR
jgi:hypothetical protein